MANTRAIFANLSSMLPPGFENNYEGAIREFSLLREIGGQLIGRVEASVGRRMWITTGETARSLASEVDFGSVCVSCQYSNFLARKLPGRQTTITTAMREILDLANPLFY